MADGTALAPAPTGRRPSAPDEVWDQVREAYLAGASAPDCCRTYGVGLSALRARSARDGWRRIDQPFSPPANRLDPWDEGLALEDRVDGDLDKVEPRELSWVAWRRMTRAILRGDAAEALRWRRVRIAMDEEADELDRLIAQDTMAVLVAELFPRVTVVTPNLDEAGWFVGHAITTADALESAARELRALGARSVLLKGGHLSGPVLTDLLLEGDSVMRWAGERIDTPNTHGTGCTLSSAIACGLARGLPLADAVAQARDYVRAALHASAQWRLGRGHGPLNHGFSPLPTTGHAQER